MIFFDHIEIHVKNSRNYVIFLQLLFNGGRFKKISENETFMFLTNDNVRFEVKQKINNKINYITKDYARFCLPCLRMKNAHEHIKSIPNLEINKVITNPDGVCIFFKDHEGIEWHIKDYEILDIYTNI